MSRQPNTKIIGGFVVGAAVLVVALLMVFGGGRFLRERVRYIMFFEGSVHGLSTGAPVTFKGVRVGSVTDIQILLDRRDMSLKIPVVAEIDPARVSGIPEYRDAQSVHENNRHEKIMELLVKQGLRAQLRMQSLVTGLLYIDLDFYAERPPRWVGIETEYPELPTIPSPLEELSRRIETLPMDELVDKLVSAVAGIEQFVNSPELQQAVSSMNQTMISSQELLRSIDSQVQPLAANVNKTLENAQRILENIDSQVDPLASSLRDTLNETQQLVKTAEERMGPLLATMDKTFETTRETVEQASRTFATVENFAGERSPTRHELNRTLRELTSAARALRSLADYLERHPEALIRGKRR